MSFSKMVLVIAGISGALAVIIGAFGAHALKDLLEQNQKTTTFETASRYHFYHTIALLIVGLFMTKVSTAYLQYSAYAFMFGMIFFSGVLYTLSLTNYKVLGAVAPLGGLMLIAGWIFMCLHFIKQ